MQELINLINGLDKRPNYEIFCGTEVVTTLRKLAEAPDDFPLTTLFGIPVTVKEELNPGRWQIRRDGAIALEYIPMPEAGIDKGFLIDHTKFKFSGFIEGDDNVYRLHGNLSYPDFPKDGREAT